MKLWIQYDQSPPHLILNVADSAEELAKITGTKITSIWSIASRVKHGKIKNGQYAVVEIDEKED